MKPVKHSSGKQVQAHGTETGESDVSFRHQLHTIFLQVSLHSTACTVQSASLEEKSLRGQTVANDRSCDRNEVSVLSWLAPPLTAKNVHATLL